MLDLDAQLLLVKQLHQAESDINDLRKTIIQRARLQDAVIVKLRERIEYSFKLARTLMARESYKNFVAKMDLQSFMGDEYSKEL